LHSWQFWPPRPILTQSMLTWHPKWGATCYFFLPKIGIGGPKMLQLQNLGGGFVVFFLRGQNRNFVKVRGQKLLLSHFIVNKVFKLSNNQNLDIVEWVYVKLTWVLLEREEMARKKNTKIERKPTWVNLRWNSVWLKSRSVS